MMSLYPSLTKEHLESLRPALCDFSIELPKDIETEIKSIVSEFLDFKKQLHGDWQNSVLNCLDFHFSSEKLKIIEANTNASGYLVSNLLLKDEKKEVIESYEDVIFKSFLNVFDSNQPEPLYIIDENPLDEKMYPEFLMFKDLFERKGLSNVSISKTSELPLEEKAFVYNRDTDFYFDKHPKLNEAYQKGLIKLSTSPVTYEKLASKKNDLNRPSTSNFPSLDKAFLESLPFSKDLWETRKKYFFKPQELFGGKGVYAGKSLSRKKFETLGDEYMAQEVHPPGKVEHGGEDWKYDIRAFFSESMVQKIVARVYQGQVTNFSKDGGGFAIIDWV